MALNPEHGKKRSKERLGSEEPCGNSRFDLNGAVNEELLRKPEVGASRAETSWRVN
jgi:hypothetical protein